MNLQHFRRSRKKEPIVPEFLQVQPGRQLVRGIRRGSCDRLRSRHCDLVRHLLDWTRQRVDDRLEIDSSRWLRQDILDAKRGGFNAQSLVPCPQNKAETARRRAFQELT